MPFPGDTYAEYNKAQGHTEPNWVGWLVQDFMKNVLVYDYAVGGANVDGVTQQVQQQFLKTVGLKPDWAKWTEDDTLFSKHWFILRYFLPSSNVVHFCGQWYGWVSTTLRKLICSPKTTGIFGSKFSCRFGNTEAYMRGKLDKLFEQQEFLYDAGARNFCFVDIPPLERTPGLTGSSPTSLPENQVTTSAQESQMPNLPSVPLSSFVGTPSW